jgi:hypothetical protein
MESASPQAELLEEYLEELEESSFGEGDENPMAPEGSTFPLSVIGGRPAKEAELELLFQKALAGQLPLDRPLRPWEPKTLSPVHLQMIMFKAMGMRNKRIAVMMDCEPVNVSIVCRHPHARYLLARLLANASEDVIDIQSRYEMLAPLALETATEVMLTGKEETKLRAAFGILDRAGYGEKKQVEATVEHTWTMPAKQADLLTQAIGEAREIKDPVYFIAQTTPSSQPPEGVRQVGGSDASAVDVSQPPANTSQAASPSSGEKERRTA